MGRCWTSHGISRHLCIRLGMHLQTCVLKNWLWSTDCHSECRAQEVNVSVCFGGIFILEINKLKWENLLRKQFGWVPGPQCLSGDPLNLHFERRQCAESEIKMLFQAYWKLKWGPGCWRWNKKLWFQCEITTLRVESSPKILILSKVFFPPLCYIHSIHFAAVLHFCIDIK